ncbi:transporter substrate-binding domain-containing protein [Streptosporangium sp. G11]|uniref:transporter substrate-binding domain-containing protein n=1 Tax=Streptosporangium sp. G11 TaxID=3436926 RepID=UPI003EBBF9A1
MAKEPADGEKRSEGVPSPPEKQGRSPRGETGGPAGDEREARPGRESAGPGGDEPGGRRGADGRERRTGRETGGTPGGERRGPPPGERDRRSGGERDRWSDDEHDHWEDERHGRGRRSHGPYERGRWDDDGYDRDRRSDDRYERDRWDDDGYDRDPRSEDTYSRAPIGPPGPSGPSRRRRFRRFRLTAWIALVVAAIVVVVSVVWVGGADTEAELREKAGLLSKDRLRIGVKHDTPNIALREDGGSGFEGFDIDIAYMIATSLGFRRDQVEFMSIETEDRSRMQASNERKEFVKVDLVVATFSVTPTRKLDPAVGFSTPYLFTEQSVVTRFDDPDVASLGQLEGKRVCSLGTSTSLKELEEAINAKPIAELLISKCVDRLMLDRDDERAVDAVTTDAALLAGFVRNSRGALRHHDIALDKTEMWAVNAGSNAALRTLVDLALYRSYADPDNKMWEEAYEKHIQPLLAANPGVDVAQARQPCALPPDVRRWPWERTLPVQDCPSAP